MSDLSRRPRRRSRSRSPPGRGEDRRRYHSNDFWRGGKSERSRHPSPSRRHDDRPPSWRQPYRDGSGSSRHPSPSRRHDRSPSWSRRHDGAPPYRESSGPSRHPSSSRRHDRSPSWSRRHGGGPPYREGSGSSRHPSSSRRHDRSPSRSHGHGGGPPYREGSGTSRHPSPSHHQDRSPSRSHGHDGGPPYREGSGTSRHPSPSRRLDRPLSSSRRHDGGQPYREGSGTSRHPSPSRRLDRPLSSSRRHDGGQPYREGSGSSRSPGSSVKAVRAPSPDRLKQTDGDGAPNSPPRSSGEGPSSRERDQVPGDDLSAANNAMALSPGRGSLGELHDNEDSKGLAGSKPNTFLSKFSKSFNLTAPKKSPKPEDTGNSDYVPDSEDSSSSEFTPSTSVKASKGKGKARAKRPFTEVLKSVKEQDDKAEEEVKRVTRSSAKNSKPESKAKGRKKGALMVQKKTDGPPPEPEVVDHVDLTLDDDRDAFDDLLGSDKEPDLSVTPPAISPYKVDKRKLAMDKVLFKYEGRLNTHLVELVLDCLVLDAKPTNWKELAGLQEVKKKMEECIIWPFQNPDVFVGPRSVERGILLYGPPGTGKTMIARCVAASCSVSFFNVGSDLLHSKYHGDSEKLVKTLFKVARAVEPCIIFFDEVDSLLGSRGHEQEHSRRVKNELFKAMEGLETSEKERVVVIGATNLPHHLDCAARRRFTSRLYVPLPDMKGRLELLKNALSPVKMEVTSQELTDIAKRTDGLSGADLKCLVKTAAMLPVKEAMRNRTLVCLLEEDEIPAVSYQHLLDAVKSTPKSVSPADIQACVAFQAEFGIKK